MPKTERKGKRLILSFRLALATFLLFLLDQITKAYFFSLPEIPYRGFWFFINPVRNYGAIFGLFPNFAGFILVLGIFFMLLFIYMVRKMALSEKKGFLYGLSFQIAGALGNLLDRIRFGYVRDFIDLHFWPVFNLADVWILTGCALLFFSLRHHE